VGRRASIAGGCASSIDSSGSLRPRAGPCRPVNHPRERRLPHTTRADIACKFQLPAYRDDNNSSYGIMSLRGAARGLNSGERSGERIETSAATWQSHDVMQSIVWWLVEISFPYGIVTLACFLKDIPPYSPITCTITSLCLGRTSKSTKMICCQVPSVRRLSAKGTVSEAPSNAARTWL
jgi:hypothetical protein